MRHMNYTDRLTLERMLSQGLPKQIIADTIGVHISTIYRELRRGCFSRLTSDYTFVPGYSADLAQRDYDYQATAKGAPLRIGNNHILARHLERRIVDARYSPYAAIWELRNIGVRVPLSVSTLYSYIHKGVFPRLDATSLAPCRKRSYNRIRRAAKAPAGTSIERRPKLISDRSTWGHWEMDCVIGKAKGKGQAILTLTERLSRYEIMVKLKNKESRHVVRALDTLYKRYKFKSITVDNGCEFSDCYGMEHDKNGKHRFTVYYCHPYCSAERGSNERHNRMIRTFLPKGSDFQKVTQKEVQAVSDRLNNLPRAVLNGQTPAQVFSYYADLEKSG